jgi:hypothetical protein
MFSSALSLRMNIKALDTDLDNYKASNDSRVDTLESFKATLEGDASVAGSIADLEAKHNEQTALINTLESNADALKARIDTFNNALGEDGEDGTISAIEQIKINKDGLATELVDRQSEISRVESLVSSEASTRLANDNILDSKIDQEIADRQSAVSAEATARQLAVQAEASARQADIALEVVNRNNAIAVETTARQSAVTAEQTARQTAIEKVGFINTCEAEGILSVNSYPFSFGMGNQSEPEYGMPVPFSYTLRGVGYSCVSSDASPSISVKISHYAFGSGVETVLYPSLTLSGKHFQTKLTKPSGSAGNLVVEVLSVSGLTDDASKFRLSLVLTCDSSLY